MPESIRNISQFLSELYLNCAIALFCVISKRIAVVELPFTMPEKRFKAIHHL